MNPAYLFHLLVFFGLLTPLVGIYLWQQLVVVPRVVRELHELNSRRVDQVREALAKASPSDQWGAPYPKAEFPFSAWVELLVNGNIKIAGQLLAPGEKFSVTTKDENNIPRASVASNGTGVLEIHSHGEDFRARFTPQGWSVERVPTIEA